MRKSVLMILCAVFIFCMTGCGDTFETKESAIYVKGNGSILEASIESFAESYYNKDDLEDFVKKSIEDYTKQHGSDSVSFTELEVENNIATLYLKYDNAKEFSRFHGEEFFSGTMAEAMAAGYTLSGTYYKVEDGKLSKEVTTNDMEEDLNVIIMKERIGVQVSGTICYVSNNVTLEDDKTISPVKDENGKVLTSYGDEYIVVIYK